MKVFAEQVGLSVCLFAGIGTSVFLKIFLGMMYEHIIREADNMASTDNKLLKQCKVKFSNCYEMNNGVSNIPVFVDKFLSRMAMGPFSFDFLYHMSGQLMMLSVVFSGIGICRGIVGGSTAGEVLPFYIVSFAGLYLYFSISAAVDIQGRKRVLKINLIDYLENHLSSRLRVTRQDVDRLYGNPARGDAQGWREKSVELMSFGSHGPEAGKVEAAADNAVTEEELEALLKEFLIG